MRTSYLFPRRSRLYPVVAGTTAAVVAVTLGSTPAVASGQAKHRHGHAPSVSSEEWGSTTEGAVQRWTLKNGRGMTVKVLTYGGIMQSILVPDRHGHVANVALGFDNLADYVAKSPYFGCITGRYANRIALGQFSIGANDYQLPINNDPNSLHGGTVGFDKHIWATTPFKHGSSVGLVMKFTSPDGDQGYPGTLDTQVTYTLTKHNEIRMDYQATTDQPTIVNLTNHNYWNLAGEGSGAIYGHQLFLNAKPLHPRRPHADPDRNDRPGGRHADGLPARHSDRRADPRRVPAARDRPRLRPQLGARPRNATPPHRSWRRGSPNRPAAACSAILTDQPGIQFYSGNFLDGTLVGTSGRMYRQGDGFALETQHYPDSPNHANFPSTLLLPGQLYNTTTTYQLGTTGH